MGGTNFGADFSTTVEAYRDAIVWQALDADMFHYMKDHALTAFPDDVLSFIGNPDYGWIVYCMSTGAIVEGAVDNAASDVPIVGGPLGWAVDKVTDVGGASTSWCWVRKYPSPLTGNVPDMPYIKDDAGLHWDVQTDAGTPKSMLEKWESRMDAVARKWGTLPDPEPLRAQAVRFKEGAEALTSERDDSQFANDDYEVPINTLVNKYALRGKAFSAFHDRYAISGRLVTANLREHMMNISGYAVADGILAQQVRESVNALLEATPAAMKASSPGLGLLTDTARAIANPETRDEALRGLFFVVAGAVVGTVATAASGGSALAVLAGVAGTGLTALTALDGVVKETKGDAPPLDADTPDEVWSNLMDGLATLDANYAAEEQTLSTQAQTTLDTLGGVIEQVTRTHRIELPFVDSPLTFTTQETVIGREHDDARTLQDADVVTDFVAPDRYAAEEVSGTESEVNDARTALMEIADIVYQASNRSVIDTGDFSRAGGLGDDPSAMIHGAAQELRLRMRNHAGVLDDGATALWEVWKDFANTDGNAGSSLDRITGHLSQSEINELYGVGESVVGSPEGLRDVAARNP